MSTVFIFFLILGCPIPGYGQEHSDCTVPCFEMCRNCMYYVDCMYLLVAVHNVSLSLFLHTTVSDFDILSKVSKCNCIRR